VENPVYEYVPNARPGARAPHCWVLRDGVRVPMLDVLAHDFLLLTHGTNGVAWGRDLNGRGIRHHHVGSPGTTADLIDVEGAWSRAYGIAGDGAVLVRPDGHVAWRAFSRPGGYEGTGLVEALDIATGRKSKGAHHDHGG